MELKCVVSEIMPLKIPKVYRLRGNCGNVELEIEFHEEVVEGPKIGSQMIVEITSDKNECMKHYFCAHGYVISNTQIGDFYRVVISLHGFLVVIKSKHSIGINVMDRVYLGVTFIA